MCAAERQLNRVRRTERGRKQGIDVLGGDNEFMGTGGPSAGSLLLMIAADRRRSDAEMRVHRAPLTRVIAHREMCLECVQQSHGRFLLLLALL